MIRYPPGKQAMQTSRLLLIAMIGAPLLAGIHEPIPGGRRPDYRHSRLGIGYSRISRHSVRRATGWKSALASASATVIQWQGARAADLRYSPACMQSQYPANSGSWNRGLNTSEDCLYLNVWTPAASADERLPVMVWIYSGGGARTRFTG